MCGFIPSSGDCHFTELRLPFSLYRMHFALTNKTQRIEALNTQYRFTCKCEACENNYPTFLKQSHNFNVPILVGTRDFDSLITYDFDYALKNYRRYCEFLTSNGHDYPCKQISSTEECLKMAFYILVDAVPLKAKMGVKPANP